MGKKILVIGSGGREHALVWKLAQSPQVNKIYAAPGNPGMADLAECLEIAVTDVEALVEFAQNQAIDLTVVGPEAPLTLGIVDRFQAANLKIFGPNATAARLEGSKVFSKNLFKKYGIPTARFEVFEEAQKAKDFARHLTENGAGAVVKADGLAAGKGVVVAADYAEAAAAIDSILTDKAFGAAGDKVLVEECLQGEELSFFAISDGQNYVSLLAAQDHKRIYDNDKGPNTGGMGAYTNPPLYNEELKQEILTKIIEPTIKAMQMEGCPYRGVLYAGLMITPQGPRILEYNARFGDPEAQVLMPMIKGDLLPILEAAADGNLGNESPEINEGACVAVVLASGGYPGEYQKGYVIQGLDKLNPDTIVFQAGTALKDGRLVTDGGRVLAVVAQAVSIPAAQKKVYQEIEKIHFKDMHYRRDIASKARI
ncbi:Phosphoribosylglycinamide synthetase [Syntrophomonas zehnderi OL-4]|uniref:Phosphoribosylamine--glycine ligase n=1 Tax=Syntrophomonas zehnderi OL-4 TaxID=690567 RepID=A0A0E4GBZ1_9FIRM|nr:phosphoribosylamine--glycine ligase [Syntrophomonas zehnderi]CFY03459.1 Phosphoribosylglycinamide synthetase [Syntrophomonas zehnderi OL-4]